jgi:hypothetical protein
LTIESESCLSFKIEFTTQEKKAFTLLLLIFALKEFNLAQKDFEAAAYHFAKISPFILTVP